MFRPVTRSVTSSLTTDVSVVPLRLRRNAVLRSSQLDHTVTALEDLGLCPRLIRMHPAA